MAMKRRTIVSETTRELTQPKNATDNNKRTCFHRKPTGQATHSTPLSSTLPKRSLAGGAAPGSKPTSHFHRTTALQNPKTHKTVQCTDLGGDEGKISSCCAGGGAALAPIDES